MKTSDLKKLLLDSLDADADTGRAAEELVNAAGSFGFREGFEDRVMDRISKPAVTVVRELEFVKSMNRVFYKIALTGVAAIILLLISMFLSEGSLSFNTFIGVGETYDESIVYLLTGN